MRNEDIFIIDELKEKLKGFNLMECKWKDKIGTEHPFFYCKTSMKNIDVYILPLCSYSNRIEIGFTVDNGGELDKEEIEKTVNFFKTKTGIDLVGMNPEGKKITSIFVQYPEPFDLDDVVNVFKELNKDEVLKGIFPGK
ncbi:hypothetical protein [Treponema sp.]|uniref:hypothetical protein n=1 Tax=Treponema sp. TaxID=166 RepID=UPI00298DE6E9|nr:hypothetical protein [Treponema sp.]MCQ2242046.1 hypothetical protein [Treponema sp.]